MIKASFSKWAVAKSKFFKGKGNGKDECPPAMPKAMPELKAPPKAMPKLKAKLQPKARLQPRKRSSSPSSESSAASAATPAPWVSPAVSPATLLRLASLSGPQHSADPQGSSQGQRISGLAATSHEIWRRSLVQRTNALLDEWDHMWSIYGKDYPYDLDDDGAGDDDDLPMTAAPS